MVHLYFNIIGVTVFLAGFYGLNAVVHFEFVNETIAAWGIAVVHSAFNIAATLILCLLYTSSYRSGPPRW